VRECGECSLCCEIPPVPAIKKPANHRCQFWDKGCNLYPDHPGQCKTFLCLWMQNDKLPERLKPDQCGVMFEIHREEKVVLALVDPFRPDAWQQSSVHRLIRRMVLDGYVVWVVVGTKKRLMLPEGVSESDARRKVEAIWRRNGGS